MNTKAILVSVGIMALLFLISLFFFGDLFEQEAVTEQIVVFPELPRTIDPSTEAPSRILLSAQNDLEFEVFNFIENGETVIDPVNTGNHILAGDIGYCLADGTCPAGYDTDAFSVVYNQEDEHFTLVILSEPIANNRKNAESFLMSRLGIGEQEMCQLHYSFSAPYWVNEFYAGRELGFSFCPGSVSLE